MNYEVEQKHPVPAFEPVEQALRGMGVLIGESREELDLYFAHPVRRFAETDEALRIRRKGSESWITYKGPKVGDSGKTRQEIELPLDSAAETPARWQKLLEVLGFTAVAEVRKLRRRADVPWQGATIALTLDEVRQLGTFVELEIIADADGVETAQGQLAALADRLGLEHPERRSYLELLLERR